jgi:hypothetical protein
MKKLILVATILIASTAMTVGQDKSLKIETLVSILKSLGIYADNKVPIGGQYYMLKNVSIEKGKNADDFVIKFTAKPID